MKSILVIGATGKQGSAVVRQLLEDGWHVRALTRDADHPKLQAIEHEQLEIFTGDMNSRDSMLEAFQGQYGVYSVQPIIRDNAAQELQQAEHIIHAAVTTGIKHLVYSTAGGVNRDRTGEHFEALAEIENKIKETTLNYTIIKPTFFMDNFLRIMKVDETHIKIPEFINPDIKFCMISAHDIAKDAANIFKAPDRYSRQEIEIASDELTLNEVCEIFTEVTGKETVIEGEFVSATAERNWLEDYGYQVDFKQLQILNHEMLPLKEWLKLQQL